MSDLDLTFICDCTGSMGSYIRSAQENIENIINKIIQKKQELSPPQTKSLSPTLQIMIYHFI